METTTRLHPLLTAAAISVTVFSAVGVATLTGLVPASIGSQNEEASLQIPQEVAKPIEPAITHPVSQPAAKVVKAKPKPVARTVAPVTYPTTGSRRAQAGRAGRATSPRYRRCAK